MPEAPKTLNTFEALNHVITSLRGPGGCPWDNEQTHTSLAPYAIEEVFEMVEALESGDDEHFCEELGDVLFQVILHAGMAKERGAFDIFDVIQRINEKVVRRHPHVFSNLKVSGSDEVLKNWDEIKKQEKLLKAAAGPKAEGGSKHAAHGKSASNSLSAHAPNPTPAIDVPAGLPALQRAHKIGAKTQKLGFDWSEVSQVVAQLKAEIIELEEVLDSKDVEKISHELGDVLFSAAQVSRHLEVEPESALREANRRFLKRFETMLSLGKLSVAEFTKLEPSAKEDLWRKAKAFLG